MLVYLFAYEQVFSRTVAAVDIKRGDMDKYHGSSVQQDSGDICPKRKHFPGG